MTNLQEDWWHSGNQLKILDQLKTETTSMHNVLIKKDTINLQELSVNV